MQLAFAVAQNSPNKVRKVGAAIFVCDDGNPIAACNTFPKGVADLDERHEGDGRFVWMEHAGRNASFTGARAGRALAGRTHQVISVVWLVSAGDEACARCVSEVSFAPLDDAAIDAYLATGEWRGKAGAYAIQGVAAAFIAHLAGSYSGVMGLPLHETHALLARFGLPTRLASTPPGAAP